MQKISDHTIDVINDRIQNMDEDRIGKVWDGFTKEQPALIGYVLGESRELQVPDAREDVAYILTIILLSFHELRPGIPSVTEAEFEKAFNAEFEEMEEVFHDGFDETDAMAIMASPSVPVADFRRRDVPSVWLALPLRQAFHPIVMERHR